MAKEVLQKTVDVAGSLFKNSEGKFSKSKLFNNALMGYFALSEYGDYRDQGDGVITAAVKTGANQALMLATGIWPYIGFELLRNSGALVESGEQLAMQRRAFYADEQYQAPFRTNTFVDNEQLYTMRQAGIALAQQAKYKQVATMMGNEARYMHR